MKAAHASLPLLCSLLLVACGGGDPGPGSGPTDAGPSDAQVAPDAASSDDAVGDDAQADTATEDAPADQASAGPCEPQAVPCTDEQILDLSLFKAPSPRVIQNEADGAGFRSHVDASGGGMNPKEAFVYARFTDNGLEKVEIGDEAAFESQAWDIAFRRFIIRLNSGVSGPSCVVGAELPDGTDYEAPTSAPAGLALEPESYYLPNCQMVPDGSGLPSPGTIFASFWKYTNCVQMTGRVFVVQLADGRQLKATVTDFYPPTAQEKCQVDGSVPAGTAGGQVRLRWAFLTP